MDEDELYSAIFILAIILGILYISQETEEEQIRKLHGSERLEAVKNLEQKRIKHRVQSRVQKLNRHQTIYDGTQYEYFPKRETAELVNKVCRSLFNISVLLEYENVDKENIVNNDDFIFLERYNKETLESSLKTILNLLKRYSSTSSKAYKKNILLKICEYLYNKGCQKYSKNAMFKMCKWFRDGN